MKIFHSIYDLQSYLTEIRKSNPNKKIGFIPTMGALHTGHGELVKSSIKDDNFTVVSIFVNPTQFNNPTDFVLYPKTEDEDTRFLQSIGCDVLYLPILEEIYPDESFKTIEVDLGNLGEIYEGKFRPGHFMGVMAVVHRLFEIVKPDIAYFGQKDYQQWLVINKMVNQTGLDLTLKMVPTIREVDGLAKSSRNKRLNIQGRKNAPIIYEILKKAYLKLVKHPNELEDIKASMQYEFSVNKDFKLEYCDICSGFDLHPIHSLSTENSCVLIVALNLGNVRLIDNVLINKDEWIANL